jgi:hypothetical protein
MQSKHHEKPEGEVRERGHRHQGESDVGNMNWVHALGVDALQ